MRDKNPTLISHLLYHSMIQEGGLCDTMDLPLKGGDYNGY